MRNIVILGAGFGGLRCALKLERQFKKLHLSSAWSIILVDKNSYHTYTAQLYEAASAYHAAEELIGSSLCLPIQKVIGKRNIAFVHREVEDMDLEKRALKLRGGDEIPFEYLVLALGSQVMYFGVHGAEEHACTLKTLHDAFTIHRKIEKVFAETPQAQEIRIMIVGGGATGVEMISEIATYTKHLARDYNRNPVHTRIFLFEAQSSILTQMNPRQRDFVLKRLGKLGVEIFTNTKIQEVRPTCVLFEGGKKCEADVILWGGGVQGPSLFTKVKGLELDQRGRVIVDEFLRVKSFSNVFAIGDNALCTDRESGEVAPATAFIAEQEAEITALNIANAITDRPLKEYHFSIPGYVVSCGGKYAVAHLFGFTFAGIFGWFIKKLIDLRYFLSLLSYREAITLWLRELRLFTKND